MWPLSSRGGYGLSGRATKKTFFCGFPYLNVLYSSCWLSSLVLSLSLSLYLSLYIYVCIVCMYNFLRVFYLFIYFSFIFNFLKYPFFVFIRPLNFSLSLCLSLSVLHFVCVLEKKYLLATRGDLIKKMGDIQHSWSGSSDHSLTHTLSLRSLSHSHSPSLKLFLFLYTSYAPSLSLTLSFSHIWK